MTLALTLGCSEPGELALADSQEPLAPRVFQSDAVPFEPPTIDLPPTSYATSAGATDGSFLVVVRPNSGSADPNQGVAYVLRDMQPVDPVGTHSSFSAPATYCYRASTRLGNHWLVLENQGLVVLTADGALKRRVALPFLSGCIVAAGDRALVVGGAEAELVDELGSPQGEPFPITPSPSTSVYSATSNGSRFLAEYWTSQGVFVVAVSTTGVIGAPATVATTSDPNSPWYPNGVVSDGQHYRALYSRGNTLMWRGVDVDGALGLSLGAEVPLTGLSTAPTAWTFFNGHYVTVGGPTMFNPDGSPATGSWYAHYFGLLSASPDGSTAIELASGGKVSAVGNDRSVLDIPPVQIGLGGERTLAYSVAFDGTRYSVLWADQGRKSIRGVEVDGDGAVVGDGPHNVSVPESRNVLASNGSSLLRVTQQHDATLTNADGTTVHIDLSALATTSSTYPTVGTNGDEYAVFDAYKAARVSAAGDVLGIVSLPNFVPYGSDIAFDGERYLVAQGVAAPTWHVALAPFSTDLTAQPFQTVWQTGDFGSNVACSLVSNGSQSLVGIVAYSDTDYRHRFFVVRVNHDFTVVDDPPLLLDSSLNGAAPVLAWDGTNYWALWYEDDTDRAFVQLISSDPAKGLLLDAPAEVPFTGALAARPGGGALLVGSDRDGAVRRVILDSRELKTGVTLMNAQELRSIAPSTRRLPVEFLATDSGADRAGP